MHLLLLHGAIGSAAQLTPLAEVLKSRYHVHVLEFPGHGGTEGDTFSIPHFADFVSGYCDEQGLDKVGIFGYSMGGYVALYLAQQRPALVAQVVTLATKFHWDPAIAEREKKMLQPAVIEEKLPAFAKTLAERHAPGDWKQVLARTAQMLEGLGADNALKPEDYAGIATPTLLLLGDRDRMVTLEETVAVYNALPQAELGVLPGTGHPIESVQPQLLAGFIERFIG